MTGTLTNLYSMCNCTQSFQWVWYDFENIWLLLNRKTLLLQCIRNTFLWLGNKVWTGAVWSLWKLRPQDILKISNPMKQFISKAVKILLPCIAFYLQDIWPDSAGELICAEELDCFLTAVKYVEFVTWSNFFLFVASILHYCSTRGGSNLRYFAPYHFARFYYTLRCADSAVWPCSKPHEWDKPF